MSVQVDVCGPGMLCLAARCSRPARLGIQRDNFPRMHFCADDAGDRLQLYQKQHRETTYTYTDAARELLAAEGRQVIA